MVRRTVTIAALAILVFAALVPFADVSDADVSGDITWYTEDIVEMDANQRHEMQVSIYNNGTSPLHIHLTTGKVSDLSVNISKSDFELKPKGTSGDRIYITLTLSTNKYANSYDGDFRIHMDIHDMSSGATTSADKDVQLRIESTYADGDAMGKILGYLHNPLPEPYNGAAWSAAISLLIWIVISAIASSLVRIACDYLVQWASEITSKRRLIDTSSFRKTWKYVFGIVMMYGLENCMVVLGIDDAIIGSFKDFTDFITILFISMTVWHIFTTFANIISYKLSDGDEESSLKPLVLLIGRLFIVLATFIAILAVSGIDPAALALAVGLGATGLSFGAKTVITQFFCGIQIMITRTFRSGDKIKVGADTTTLVVKEVGIMTTRCKNWSNEEIFYIPNSAMSDAKVVNITKDNVYYKVYDYFTISHDSDIGMAREIMVEVAYGDEGVVADGSFSKPDVRFDTVNTNEISLRLAYTVIDHEDYGVISARIREKIFKRFTEEGIEIPYPQYCVNIIPSDKKDE